MKNGLKSRSGAALVAAVIALALSQILLSAHAAKYGDGPHDHNGQVCVLSLAAPGGDKLIATAAFVFAAFLAVWRIFCQSAESVCARIAVRAPQSRGPPSL